MHKKSKEETELLFEEAKIQLKNYWGFEAFRPGQDKVVKSVLSGKDTLVLFPTGGGKSLCFQVPALVFDGLSLVISPLVALMQDQVEALKRRRISANFINSTLSQSEIEQRLINARNGMYKMLYVAPERLGTEIFQYELNNLPLSMIAIDEAHCISEWGHRFRPSYRKIRENLRPVEDKVSWVALTATATPKVKQDIIDILEFKNPEIISKGYIRENLAYRVEFEENKPERLKELLIRAKGKGAGLIYGATRKSCEELSKLIGSVGLKSEPYHAGLETEQRNKIQQEWISGTTPWVAATNAFGMGIDKPDCRFVFHQSPPASLEAYYQEAGRAGRDGELSFPVLLYADSDFKRIQEQLGGSYPDFEELNRIYHIVADIGYIAEGELKKEAFDVDISEVSKRSHINRTKVYNALDLLHQFECWTAEVKSDKFVSVKFQWSFSMIESYLMESTNQEKNFFLEVLMRSFNRSVEYEFQEVEIQYLEKRLHKKAQIIKKGLLLLEEEGILEAKFADRNYRVFFSDVRYPKIPLSKTMYDTYRAVQFEKLEKVREYCRTEECRNAFFSAYFGEVLPSFHCENCDNCRKKLPSSKN